jgi:alkylation response protein AidB-like acyl-CoA dehydrogenase
MAWDFQTEPEFQEQLDWTARFVREEIWPMEPVADELDQATLQRIYAPLQQQVKARGLWAAHLDPDLGGQGFGQLKLGLLHEILGSSPYAPKRVRVSGTGLRELRDPRDRRHARTEGALAAAAPRRGPEVALRCENRT